MPSDVCPVRSITPFLATRDVSATIEFYTTRLGFRVELLHPRDNPTLVFLDAIDPTTGSRAGTLVFASNLWRSEPTMTGQLLLDFGPQGDGPSRVLAMFERIRPHVLVEWGPEVYGYGRREFSFKDCNGYSVVLSESTVDPPTCDE